MLWVQPVFMRAQGIAGPKATGWKGEGRRQLSAWKSLISIKRNHGIKRRGRVFF
jgi:hypothetical protein